jgi:hypothetical protein
MKEFWQKYKDAHQFTATRWFHAVGTFIGLILIVNAVLSRLWWVGVAGLCIAYGMAWFSHYAVEGNSPMSLKSPLKSFLCDIAMCVLMFTGRNPK